MHFNGDARKAHESRIADLLARQDDTLSSEEDRYLESFESTLDECDTILASSEETVLFLDQRVELLSDGKKVDFLDLPPIDWSIDLETFDTC